MPSKTSSLQGKYAPAYSQACSLSTNKASPLFESTQHNCFNKGYDEVLSKQASSEQDSYQLSSCEPRSFPLGIRQADVQISSTQQCRGKNTLQALDQEACSKRQAPHIKASHAMPRERESEVTMSSTKSQTENSPAMSYTHANHQQTLVSSELHRHTLYKPQSQQTNRFPTPRPTAQAESVSSNTGSFNDWYVGGAWWSALAKLAAVLLLVSTRCCQSRLRSSKLPPNEAGCLVTMSQKVV